MSDKPLALADRLESEDVDLVEDVLEAAAELRRLHSALAKYEADDVRYMAELRRLHARVAELKAAPAPVAQPCPAGHVCDCQEAGVACQRAAPAPVAQPPLTDELLAALDLVRMSRGWQYMAEETRIVVSRAIRAGTKEGGAA